MRVARGKLPVGSLAPTDFEPRYRCSTVYRADRSNVCTEKLGVGKFACRDLREVDVELPITGPKSLKSKRAPNQRTELDYIFTDDAVWTWNDGTKATLSSMKFVMVKNDDGTVTLIFSAQSTSSSHRADMFLTAYIQDAQTANLASYSIPVVRCWCGDDLPISTTPPVGINEECWDCPHISVTFDVPTWAWC
jgi:hypothetical protein